MSAAHLFALNTPFPAAEIGAVERAISLKTTTTITG